MNPKQNAPGGSLTPSGMPICTTRAVTVSYIAMHRQVRHTTDDEESDLNSGSSGEDVSEDIGSQDTSDDDDSDDDSVGSLDLFVTDEIVPMEPGEPDVSEVSAANIIVGKRTRRPAPPSYQDPEYLRLMLDDVPKHEIDIALGLASTSSSDADDGSFKAGQEDSGEASYEEEEEEGGTDEEDTDEEDTDEEDTDEEDVGAGAQAAARPAGDKEESEDEETDEEETDEEESEDEDEDM